MIKYKVVDDKLSVGYMIYHEESPGCYVAVIRQLDLGFSGLSAFALISWYGMGLTRLAEVRKYSELIVEALRIAEQLEEWKTVEEFREHVEQS